MRLGASVGKISLVVEKSRVWRKIADIPIIDVLVTPGGNRGGGGGGVL